MEKKFAAAWAANRAKAEALGVKIRPVAEEDAVKTARQLMNDGMSPTAAAKEAAALTGFRKNEIYRAILNEEQ
jgi:16S rRNA (cytidine1402-2'-O)-methyltransferase